MIKFPAMSDPRWLGLTRTEQGSQGPWQRTSNITERASYNRHPIGWQVWLQITTINAFKSLKLQFVVNFVFKPID